MFVSQGARIWAIQLAKTYHQNTDREKSPLCIYFLTPGLALLLDLASLLVLTCYGVGAHRIYSNTNPDVYDSKLEPHVVGPLTRSVYFMLASVPVKSPTFLREIPVF